METLRTNLFDVKNGDKMHLVNGGKCGPNCDSTHFDIHSDPVMTLDKNTGISEGVLDERQFNGFVNTGQINIGFKVTCSECQKSDFVTLEALNKMKNHLEIRTP